ncbi:MAG: GNAT family N-acetyltransferase [Acidobacteriales bacterium]|nr:GNAT family N-acetyltransferase [Terriglobales bacterium]
MQVATQSGIAVDRALARRLELAEEMAGAAVALAHRRTVPGSQAAVLPIAGGSAIFVEPGSPISQCIGCGVTEELQEADIGRIEEFYWSRGNVSQIVVSCAFAPGLEQMLHRRGYNVIEENLAFFRRLPLESSRRVPEGYVIREVGEAERERWAQMQAEVFSEDLKAAQALMPTFLLFTSAEGYRSYVAIHQATGEFAGGAAICLIPQGQVACLAGAATRPQHRKRGLQAAMLEHRLADAAAGGCDLAFVSTLPENTSYRNAARAGFVEAYRRLVLTRQQP